MLKEISGKFNGKDMLSEDGIIYPVPANYASKSRLVEGDLLKLNVKEDCSFQFKQIKPIPRRYTIGLAFFDGKTLKIQAEGKTYHILTASVTYYRIHAGQQVRIIIPDGQETSWAAVENVVEESPDDIEL